MSSSPNRLRSISSLLTGTMAAQLVSLIGSPFLARVFPPADFGLFAGYIAVVSIGSLLISGRYEWAVIQSRGQTTAVNIMRLVMLLALSLSIIGTLLVSLLPNITGLPSGILFVAGLGMFTVATDRVLVSFLIRVGKFSAIALNRFLQSSTMLAVQLTFGLAGFGVGGLVAGQIIGQIVGVFAASRSIGKKHIVRLNARYVRIYARLAAKFRSFPLMVLPGSLANEAANQLPLILTFALFGVESAGLLGMTQRLITAPVSLITTAIGEVLRSEAAIALRRKGNCWGLVMRYLWWVLSIATMISLTTYLVGGDVLVVVLGVNWENIEPVIAIMSILMFGQLASLPFSHIMVLAGKQGWDLAWNVGRLVAIAGVFGMCALLEIQFLGTLLLFCLTSLGFSLVNLVLQVLVSRGVSDARG